MQAIVDPTYEIEFPPIPDAALLDVMKRCLQRDPSKRPTIEGDSGLLQHPYLHPESISSLLFEKLSELGKARVDAAVTDVKALMASLHAERSSPAPPVRPTISAAALASAKLTPATAPVAAAPVRASAPAPPRAPAHVPASELVSKRQALRRIDQNVIEEQRQLAKSKPTGLAAMLQAKFQGGITSEDTDTFTQGDTWFANA